MKKTKQKIHSHFTREVISLLKIITNRCQKPSNLTPIAALTQSIENELA